MIADAVLYLPFALIPSVSAILCVAVVVLGIVVEMTGVIAIQVGASRRYDGPLGKSDRAFLFGALALLLGLGLAPGAWLTLALWAALALGGLTIANRVRRALREAAP